MPRLWPMLAPLVSAACAPPGPAGPGARVALPPDSPFGPDDTIYVDVVPLQALEPPVDR